MIRTLIAFAVLASTSIRTHADVTVYRDAYGTPAIVAQDSTQAFYGLGYAMANDNAVRMALNYKQARGRLAEVEGKGGLLMDGFLRSLGIEDLAIEKAKELDGEVARFIDAFCKGANRSLEEQRAKLPKWIEPFSRTDVLALTQLLMAAFPLQDLSRELMPSTGSNQFAVHKSRSANGHALLSTDPHLPWDGILAWYEFGVESPDFTFHGITIPGLPFGALGHTNRVAWCMTNNDPDLYDIFLVKSEPGNPKRYSYHGEWREYGSVVHEMKYLENGEMKSRKQMTKTTAWGPMLPLQSRAVRFTMIGDWSSLDQVIRMARSRNANEFRESLRTLGISMFNIVYADIDGNIGYQYNGRVPDRNPKFDWRKPVPGDSPETKWGELWSIDRLPHVANPKSGLLVNCNSSPWLAPLGDEIAATGWPAFVTTYGPTTRFDNLSALLAADRSISVDEAKRYATDTRVPRALAVKKAFATAIRVGHLKPEGDDREAWKVLDKWNGRADVDSRGTALYLYWFRSGKAAQALSDRAEKGGVWTAEEVKSAWSALVTAADAVKKRFGSVDVAWGRVQTAKRGDKTTPVAGYGYVGGRTDHDQVAAVMPTFGTFENGGIHAIGGSSFRMVMDLDPKGVKSWSILPYGDSNDPGNPHFADQMELYGRGKYKPVLFGVANIEKGAVEKKVLVVP